LLSWLDARSLDEQRYSLGAVSAQTIEPPTWRMLRDAIAATRETYVSASSL
jgi:hypothetical protein